MSVEKHRSDASRWYSQAKADLRASRKSRDAESFEWACFQSQQAAEKALKALWLHSGLDPWGHSVYNLIADFPITSSISKHSDAGLLLDKLYIPTRYPSGLPGLSPHEAYKRFDADSAIEAAEKIVHEVARLMVN